ncbi:MAG: DASS family sodium-coupled anion symporter [Limisphaera sp.]|nr:DASS family sodium-coupled anion symporter [Limisphaera sp.]
MAEPAAPPLPTFERYRRRGGWILAPVVFVGLWAWPFDGLPEPAHRMLAILGLVMVLWLSEALPLGATALLGPCLCVLLGVGEVRSVFQSFGHPVLFLFLGSFLLAAAMVRHGLSRRLALALMSLPGVADRPARLLTAYTVTCVLLSMWISNTTTAAMMFPMGAALLREMARRQSVLTGQPVDPADLPYTKALMLVTAFGASIGGMATPVGSPPNLIGMALLREQAGVEISFLQWVALGLPIALVLAGFLVVYFHRVCPAPNGAWSNATTWLATARAQLGPWRRGEIQVLAVFALTVTLWLLPGLAGLLLGPDTAASRWLHRHLPEEICALLGALLLFALPAGDRRGQSTLSWEDVRTVDWGTILLFGGGLALGESVVSSGLGQWIGQQLAAAVPNPDPFTLTVLFTGIAVLLTETTSNTATANLVVPMALAVSEAAGVWPVPPALGACLGASLAFMLPVSTPPNALVYGSGWISLGTMLRHGLVTDLVGVVAVVATVTLWLPCVLRGAG